MNYFEPDLLVSSTPQTSSSASSPKQEQQQQHAPKKRTKPCLACQTRKIACKVTRGVTEAIEVVGCEACALHKLVCSKITVSPDSISHTTTSTSSTDFNYEQLHSQAKPLRTREGRTIKALKRHHPLSSSPPTIHVNFSPSSTSHHLSLTQFSFALQWSLSTSAFEPSSIASLSPLSSLGVMVGRFRSKQIVFGNKDPATKSVEDLLWSVLVAIGSRRSSHSAIVGPPTHQSQMLLGQQREQACRKLAERVIDQVLVSPLVGSGIGKEVVATMESLEVLTAVKEMLMLVHPTHEFSFALTTLLQAHRSSLERQNIELSFDDEVRTGFALFDARTSALAHRKPILTETMLMPRQYIGKDLIRESIERLGKPEEENPSRAVIAGWILIVQLEILRMLMRLEDELRFTPSQGIQSFRQSWSVLDLCINFVTFKLRSTPSPPLASSPSPSINAYDTTASANSEYSLAATQSDYAGQVPDIVLCESHLFRVLERVKSENEEVQGLWEEGRKRFLKGVVWLGGVLDESKFTKLADVHWLARRLEVLDVVPRWVEMAFESADRGEGLVQWNDLKTLLKIYRGAGVVYAASSLRGQELEEGLLRRERHDSLAMDMVQSALFELE